MSVYLASGPVRKRWKFIWFILQVTLMFLHVKMNADKHNMHAVRCVPCCCCCWGSKNDGPSPKRSQNQFEPAVLCCYAQAGIRDMFVSFILLWTSLFFFILCKMSQTLRTFLQDLLHCLDWLTWSIRAWISPSGTLKGENRNAVSKERPPGFYLYHQIKLWRLWITAAVHRLKAEMTPAHCNSCLWTVWESLSLCQM